MQASLLCFLIGMVFICIDRRRIASRLITIPMVLLGLIYVLFTTAHILSNYFTGEGINQAVIYHVVHELYSEHATTNALLVASACLLLTLSSMVIFMYMRLLHHPTNNHSTHNTVKLKYLGSFLFLVTAVSVHPTIDALWHFYAQHVSSHALIRNDPHITERFEDHYVAPKLKAITQHHPNLVFIYAESLEKIFFDETMFPNLLPNLSSIASNHTSFDNITQIAGTGWTIAGMVASQCGLPLLALSGMNSMSGTNQFYGNATCLGDLLKKAGYHTSMLQGSSIQFSGIEAFYKNHQFDKVEGKQKLLARLKHPVALNTWGLYDDITLDMAFKEYQKLSQQTPKFALVVATMDTHQHGHISKKCEAMTYQNGSHKVLNAIHCADVLLANFIRKIQASPMGHNTVIVLASDHLSMNSSVHKQLKKTDRKNTLIIIRPAQQSTTKQVTKLGSTLDTGPTVLHALGYDVALGLGRSLLGNQATLLEKITNINAHLRAWSNQLELFWNFPSITDDIHIDTQKRNIHIGNHRYQYPALIKVHKDMSTSIYLTAETSHNIPLHRHLTKFNAADTFIWIDKCSMLYGSNRSLKSSATYCIVMGQLGGTIIGDTLHQGYRITPKSLQKVNQSVVTQKALGQRRMALSALHRPLYEHILRQKDPYYNRPTYELR